MDGEDNKDADKDDYSLEQDGDKDSDDEDTGDSNNSPDCNVPAIEVIDENTNVNRQTEVDEEILLVKWRNLGSEWC